MSDKPCVLCNHNIDDALQFGEKLTHEDTTAHLYCLLLTSNLVQNGEDDEGISGFMPKDIKAELCRTKKLLCYYCREKGATIGCCVKSCRRSFHLPCALENDCRLEFNHTFQSFCDIHHEIEEPNVVHMPTDLCTVCYDEMGPYNPIRSIPLPCCNKNSWCHKLCLQKYAQTSGYFLKCPLCKDSNQFRDFISRRGVFIPDRDAKWEVDGSGPNTFYDFGEHSMRPSECEAKVCKCHKGRKHQVDTEHHRHSLIFCQYCGSHAIHLGCSEDVSFLCEDCLATVKEVGENSVNSSASTVSDIGTMRTANNSACSHSSTSQLNSTYTLGSDSGVIETNSDTDERLKSQVKSPKSLTDGFKLREFSIRLRRLSPHDFGFKLESMESSSDENQIKPTVHKRKKPTKIFISSSTDDSDHEVIPAKRKRIYARNSFSDSESEQEKPKFDINDNSRDMPSSNPNPSVNKCSLPKSVANSLRVRQFSSSDEEHISLNGSNVNKLFFSDSSDDQIFDKENEKPVRSVAVFRPFSQNDTSTDDCIKPAKITRRSRPIFSSGEEFDPQENPFENAKECSSMNVDESDIRTKTTLSPSKKKRRTVLSYFRDTSSSDDEPHEPKLKKKSPKMKQRSPKESAVASNQSTIMQFFQRQQNQFT